jgi:hypothetical protein
MNANAGIAVQMGLQLLLRIHAVHHSLIDSTLYNPQFSKGPLRKQWMSDWKGISGFKSEFKYLS